LSNATEVSTVTFKATAPSSRQALRLLREQMGPDAYILSSRVTGSGVEILATLEEQVVKMMTPVRPVPAPVLAPPVEAPSSEREESLLREIHSMRGMIEDKLDGMSRHDKPGSNPLRSQLLRPMLGAGFSARLAQDILAQLPEGSDLASGMDFVKAELARQLPILEDENAMMDAGGVYALTGPTGVGKTTTTAKLAARCVMRFGAKKLALVTTDGFRIGAYEQLRIYGQILGVSVHAVKDAGDLERALLDLSDKHMVLIDTVGMSQRDRAVSSQISMLCGASRPVKRLLLLNASSHGDTLNEVVQAYRRGGKEGGTDDLAGCIFTKVDEATHPGVLIDMAIRHQLPLHYISNGQKVPENLLTVKRGALIDLVFNARSSSSLFVPAAAEIGPLPVALDPQAAKVAAEALYDQLQNQCKQLMGAMALLPREAGPDDSIPEAVSDVATEASPMAVPEAAVPAVAMTDPVVVSDATPDAAPEAASEAAPEIAAEVVPVSVPETSPDTLPVEVNPAARTRVRVASRARVEPKAKVKAKPAVKAPVKKAGKSAS
jgi:flagellar biosynthesis protein FlhF